ncbi:MAG: ABC transporter permease [Bacillota bacterium]
MLFSIHNAFRKKAVSVLAVLGVAFGTALMAFLFSLAGGMERRVDQTFSDLSNRITVSGRDAIFGGVFLGMGTPPIPSSYAEEIRKIPHVERVYTQVSAILRPQDINYVMPLYGFCPEEIPQFANTPHRRLIEGTLPQNDREIIIGKSLQDYMEMLNSPYRTGEIYRFRIMEKGRAREVELLVTGVYRTGNEIMDGAFSGHQNLAREIGKIPRDKISAANVFVDGVDNVEAVARAIESGLAEKVPEVQVVVPEEVLNPVKNVLDVLGNFLVALSLVAVVAGGLSIMVIMLLSVITRMKEFGILKALGWTPASIILMVLVESLVLSMLGSAAGIALGYGGLALAKTFIADDITTLTWRVAFCVCLAGIAIGVAGGIYPAFRAGRAAPAQILREV